MSKKKKKVKAISPKQQEAQYRNAYLRKLTALAESIGGEDFQLLTGPALLRQMFELRFRNGNVVPVTSDIPASALTFARVYLDKALSTYNTELYEGGPTIPLRDFVSFGQTLYFFLSAEGTYQPSEILRQRFDHYIKSIEKEGIPYYKIHDALWFSILGISEMDSRLYWMNHKFVNDNDYPSNQFQLHSVRPPQKRICINGKSRIVYRAGWAVPNDGPIWLTLDKSLFDPTHPEGQTQVPVYIQPHAMHRMSERLDCIQKTLQHYYLFVSLLKPVVVQNQNGQLLIAYQYGDHKLGYLLVDLVEDMLLIRTFLFLTMDSTPEGKALQDAVGLEAVDKKYLAIDRLSTFVNSDINDSPDVKQHFLEAGCHDLFSMDNFALPSEKPFELAQYIRSYLDVSKAKNSDVTDEEPVSTYEDMETTYQGVA